MRTMNHFFKKGTCIAFLMLGTMTMQSVSGYDLSGMNASKSEKRAGFFLRGADKKYAGQIVVAPKSEFPKLKVSAEPEALVIDNRELFTEDVTKRPIVRFYFNRVDQSQIVYAPADGKKAEETNRLFVELQSDIPSEMTILFEGQTETDGKKKHFWKAKNFMLNGTSQTLTFDQVFPANLKSLFLRIEIKKPCRLSIRKIVFAKVPVEKKRLTPVKTTF